MSADALNRLLNQVASDFVFLEGPELDVPSCGALLNRFDEIIGHAQTLEWAPLAAAAEACARILEKLVLGAVEKRDEALGILSRGIPLMQAIADGYGNTGRFDGDVQPLLSEVAGLIGVTGGSPATEQAPSEEPPRDAVVSAAPSASDDALVRDFIAEGLEYIDEIEVNILNLEQDPSNKDYINTVFRPFHSIKGVASFLNLERIRDLAHSLENLLDKARNGELPVTSPMIDIILDGADTLKEMIGRLRDQVDGKDIPREEVDISLFATRIRALETKGGQTPAAKKLGEILVEDGAITEAVLESGLRTVREDPAKRIGEVLISEGKVSPKQVSRALRKQVEQVAESTTIRIDTAKLDDLIDMVGELVITQSMIQQDLNGEDHAEGNIRRNIAQLFRITSELQRTSTSLRMIPIRQTFQRISRLIRDLARNSQKLVSVEMFGEETEIDRNMVDEIYNPLVHMVRNAVDHGLETPAERAACGKDEKGLIRLKAYHRGGKVVIEIGDDGRGLDRRRIVAKALKNGWIHGEEGLTDADVYRLIFMPGLSTAEKVTDVSGRGVGMDVVKQAVERLRGKVEIDSTPGRGTTFVTSFPLTLAIIDGMIVKVGRERFILPTTSIRQAMRPTRETYNRIVNSGETITVMGKPLALIRLHDLFRIAPDHRDPWNGIVIVLDGEGRSKCLLVDGIVGKAEVVIKSLGEGLRNTRGISGGAILGDGRIGLILDTEGLFEISEEGTGRPETTAIGREHAQGDQDTDRR